jgi:putative oxidoreductase
VADAGHDAFGESPGTPREALLMTTTEIPTPTRRRARTIALCVAEVLLVALFAVKSLGPRPEIADALAGTGLDLWLRYFHGVLEAVGAVGLLVPRVSGTVGPWLVCIVVGAILTQLFDGFEPSEPRL